MALATNITRRIGSKNYYARITVPIDLQIKLRKQEIWKSLRTPDPVEAKRRARPIVEHYDREFGKLRARRSLTDHELQTAIWNRYSELVRADQERRMTIPITDDFNDFWRMLVDEYGDEEDIRA